MSWVESNMERLRGIRGTVSDRANRAAASKEASKNRLFGSISDLTGKLYDKNMAERAFTQASQLSMQEAGQSENLERLRQQGDIGLQNVRAEDTIEAQNARYEKEQELQELRQDWTSDERIAAEKAAAGLEEWRLENGDGAYANGYYKNPLTGQVYTWNNREDYEFAKASIMQEAAVMSAKARNERESSDWWPMYEQVAGDMMRMSTEIWDPTTGEFVGWNNAGGKEELVNRFTLGMSNRKDLTEDQKQAAIDYFASYLESIENGDVSATIQEGADGSITILPPDTYATQTFEQGTSGQFNPGLKNTWQSEEAVGGGGTQAGAQEKVSPIVEQFWGELEKFTAIEPEVEEVVTSQFTGDIPVQRDDERQMWNQIQSLLSTFTKGDVSTLNDSEERELNLLIRHGTQDNSLSKRQLDQLYDLVRKINENKVEFEGQMNTGTLAPQPEKPTAPPADRFLRIPK